MRVGLTLDVADLEVSTAFWTGALRYDVEGTIEDKYVTLTGDGPPLQLQRVTEQKASKNRLHLDLYVADLEAETRRLEALGASRVDREPHDEFGFTWLVLADPDGNEFCLARDA